MIEHWVGWAVGGLMTAVLAVLGWVARVLVRLPHEYVPREQVNKRFQKIEHDIEREFQRNDGRLQRFEDKLDEILRILANKQDR